MTIAVTGATGHLGRLVVDALIARGAAPGDIVATARDTTKAAGLAALGVQVREADYDRPETLAAAFAGVDRLLLISGNAIGQRVSQHTAVVEAAKAAGVGFLAYTSILRADTSPIGLAPEHLATEQVVAASGIPFALLRNGWYIENYAASFGPAVEHGALLGSAGDGRIAAATRADFAEAAAVVLLRGEPGVHELAGDQPFTMAELAAEVARQTGAPVAYQDLPADDYRAALVTAGLPGQFADLFADTDVKIRDGHLDDSTGTLSRLIGRSTTPLAEAVATALKG
ncbi:NAD(P)-dependent oxidoreductase [Actinoplanes lobatus]|uniref:NAD(P)-dependent oxidoreductase n=1 Tax=Actinoplanes lobatus TaxID=113568 RepID=A0A7W7MI61_9ACTN|nr:SDR family oxidoreductase [Actinoplanes lobatus]MBB4750675.1 NAD(P)H dehydrogenase (quinone) [Actinoplanes lobatus]GGN69142.1 NAD(P)-dependent oxidoreductase [Actinoplanes lobatus]GIE44207.1 NAD(P)-dependent oxidoreductase [Actinoplanes lobatus]